MLVKRIQGHALHPDETTFGDLQKLWLQTFKSFVTGKTRSPTSYDKYCSLFENPLQTIMTEVNEKSQTIITGLIEKNWPPAPLSKSGRSSKVVKRVVKRPLSSKNWQKKKRRNRLQRLGFNMVGLGGLEPQTSSMSTKRSNQLSYNPKST